ncbi:MAG: alpha/beta fold hydrolase [Thermoleophilia bacterium]
MADDPVPFEVTHAGATLAGEESGGGTPVLLLHGLSATRRYVLHGSRSLERAGHRVIAFDARGHGGSSPAPAPDDYTYPLMIDDTVAVLDHLGVERCHVVGQSMGSATGVGLTLTHPERVLTLTVITPAHRGAPSSPRALERWDRLAAALERGGPEAFVEALEPFRMDERFRDTVRTVIRQRLSRHAHPDAVADALRSVPRSHAFEGMDALEAIAVPTLVVGSRDNSDPDHPLRIAQEYADRIPGAVFTVEDVGESPLAWRGGALSKAIAAHVSAAAPGG